MPDLPILWSFRRCPYAMRARLAVVSSGVVVELREILLKDKPQPFLDASPSKTVPSLCLPDHVVDESLDIMVWALKQNDPKGFLIMPEIGWDLIARNDGPFKAALDHTKYATRFPHLDPVEERAKASEFLMDLNAMLDDTPWLFGSKATLADIAILPFVRQFANADRDWFLSQDWPNLTAWLDHFTSSADFAHIMTKHKPWALDDAPVWLQAA